MSVLSAHAIRCVRVGGKRGIHLRPAAEIVAVASRFPCAITIRCGAKKADAKSVLDLLLFTAEEGAELAHEAGGPESHVALAALGEVLAKRG